MGVRAKQNKYIDLNQFVHNKQGNISWKDSVGIIAEFFYNEKRHIIEIINYKDYQNIDIKVDNININNIDGKAIKELKFERLFYEPNYFYNIGDVINNLLILEQIQILDKNTKYKNKAYVCKCLNDGYVLTKEEDLLRRGYGCPVCDNKIIVKGVNDIGTIKPELVCFLANESDAYTHSICSNDVVFVKCKYCGSIDSMTVYELNRRGGFVCDRCSDGISYPNKFAHELFRQLSEQYEEYVKEYSPSWSGKMRYDNYILFKDGREIIVEMDGAFHFNKYEKFNSKNDKEKELLALNHNIIMIHINCNYDNTKNRFEYIKKNTIEVLHEYFDLSNVDWILCNKASVSNMMENIIEYFNTNINCSIKEIAEHFGISMSTTYDYIHLGNEVGICNYIKNDINRSKHKICDIN